MSNQLPNPFPKQSLGINTCGKNGTIVAFVLDKSGSMSSVTRDTIGGYNTFLNKQKDDQTRVTLCLFDTGISFPFVNQPSLEVPELNESTYVPSGGTALNDAVGDTITRINDFLGAFPIEQRPFVVVCIMTDGEENSSRRYTRNQIKDYVVECQEKEWEFAFLGANIDAFEEARSLGLSSLKAATYTADSLHVGAAYASTSDLVTRFKSARSFGLATNNMTYSDEERGSMVADDEEKN